MVLVEEVEDFAELGDLVGAEGGVFKGLCRGLGRLVTGVLESHVCVGLGC